ncbi:MAG: hypothetical protein U1E69_11200 [Tabrizicola sp.]|uniref:hypothetical protein n=1 Tax=Tabrizicola sp. TaxID=2005166 RepID=UPI002AB9621F|nr:hypothetical protein [Tabrizicola sp.]MDZ4087356.1 hypothetical protein [Tabrizicola sp.]
MFKASRMAGLDRLTAFLPRAGRDYAALRNLDLAGHPHVSTLSPWLRHRLVTEAEVIDATLRAHPQGAEKFLAEVWWRTYWKGWPELRPGIWTRSAGRSGGAEPAGGRAGTCRPRRGGHAGRDRDRRF